MAAEKKTTKKKARRGNPRDAITETLNRLERDLPPNLSRMVRQVRQNLLDLEKQVEKARAKGRARSARSLERAAGPRSLEHLLRVAER